MKILSHIIKRITKMRGFIIEIVIMVEIGLRKGGVEVTLQVEGVARLTQDLVLILDPDHIIKEVREIKRKEALQSLHRNLRVLKDQIQVVPEKARIIIVWIKGRQKALQIPKKKKLIRINNFKF
jgi:hypothetical protein